MRDALAGLTTRGRSFLAAGLAAVVCAVLLGQRDLLRVGILLTALPLASAVVVARTRYRVACARRVEPSRITAGSEARVTLRLDNVSRLPTGLLLVEDRVPYVLGSRPRFVLDRVEPRGRREVAYPVRSDVRGRYTLGPLTVRLTDPFGMCELDRSFSSRDTLVVTPVVHPLPAVALGGEWTGSGESHARAVAAAGEDDVATREYRHGDDLRRVHWRSTARCGELMVRREEQPWQSRCTLLLDTRGVAHRGDGPGSSFDWAVSATASVGLHMAGRGYSVRLVTDTGSGIFHGSHRPGLPGEDFEGLLLDTLAVVTPSKRGSLRGAAAAVREGGNDGLLIAVLGEMRAEEVEELARVRHGTTTAIAVLIDAGSWAYQSGHTQVRARERYDGNLSVLRKAGWRVLPASAASRLPALWPLAAQGAQEAGVALAAGGTR